MDLRKEGKNFEKLIKDHKMSAFQFIRKTDTSSAGIYKYTNGRCDLRNLQVCTLVKFCKVLEISIDEFYRKCGIDLYNE